MKYTRIPANTFKQLQLNAGILAANFAPDTGEVTETDLLGATTGGVNFTATPTYSDFGDDIDNAPTNVKELKHLDGWEATMSGNFVTVDTELARRLIGASDIDGSDTTLVKPRNDVAQDDFKDIWWIGDYSSVNEDGTENGKAGFIAIHMLNSLSTGGFQVQSGNREKGQFAFTFTGHYSLEDQSRVPFEVYIRDGEADASGLSAPASNPVSIAKEG